LFENFPIKSNLLLPNTYQHFPFYVQVNFGTHTFSELEFFYGRFGAATYSPINCTQVNATFVHCLTVPSVGANNSLSFVGAVDSSIMFVDSSRNFSFPAPTIAPLTLRTPTQPHADPLVLSTGTVVVFNGNNFVPDENMVVTFGPQGNTGQYICALIPDQSNATEISCNVASEAAGGPFQFQVTVPGFTAQGTDQIQMGYGPQIYGVSGCLTVTVNTTSSCPTVGGTVITITGDGFDSPAVVLVNNLNCVFPEVLSVNQIRCRLPASTGAPATMSVFVFSDVFIQTIW
jgi:hypothetical protein